MTQVEQLADFVVRATYEDLSEDARQELKLRVLDAKKIKNRGVDVVDVDRLVHGV